MLKGMKRLAVAATYRFRKILSWINSHPAAAAFYLSVLLGISGAYKFFLENQVTVEAEGHFSRFRGDRKAIEPLTTLHPARMRVLFSNRGLIATSIKRIEFIPKPGVILPPDDVLVTHWADPTLTLGDTPFAIPARSSVLKIIEVASDAYADNVEGLAVTDIDNHVIRVRWAPGLTVDLSGPAASSTKAKPDAAPPSTGR